MAHYSTNTSFRIGDRVEKIAGDYTFEGKVVAVFPKLSGVVRYVVENQAGILMIYNFKQLKLTEPDSDA